MSAVAVSACSPPESSESVRQPLARRLREDFEPCLKRIFALGELQRRLAAFEQRREQLGEMRVDLFERRASAACGLHC